LRKLIADIRAGAAPEGLLAEMLRQSVNRLKEMSEHLLTLQDSSSPAVRARFVGSLSSEWLGTELARELAQKALLDEAPQVRTAATSALRQQSQM
jgi:hypothetical protein